MFQKIDLGSGLRTKGLSSKLDVDPTVPDLDVLADRVCVVVNQASRSPILSDRTDALFLPQCPMAVFSVLMMAKATRP